MSKSVLFSIKPKYCELIASGKKTIEVRKTKPKLDTPFKCYIYCTKGELLTRSNNNGKIYVAYSPKYQKALERNGNITLSGKVIGEFVCDGITYFGNVSTDPWCALIGDVHEWHKQLVTKYACFTEEELLKYGGKYGWHISNLVIYDKPRELGEFRKPIECHRGKDRENCVGCWDCEITRPPQSWCYVEELI